MPLTLPRPALVLSRALPAGIPVLRKGTERAMRELFGEPLDPSSHPGDPGLLGPASATWVMLGDPAVAISGINALMIQTLHPRAMAGVYEHGSFQRDLMGRLHRTAAYVQAVNCGSTADAFAASRRARGAHVAVTGTTPGGQPYAASNPHLLAWVSISLTLSVLSIWELLGPRPVPRSLADRYVAEQAMIAALLDPDVDLRALEQNAGAVAELRAGTLPLPMITDGALPTSRAGLEQMIAAYLPELAVGEHGRAALDFLMRPPLEGISLVGWKAVATAAIAALPVELRELAGYPVHPRLDGLRVEVVRAAVDTLRLVHGGTSTVRRARARAAA